MKNKITLLGEVLIDWTCLDKTLDLNKANQFIKLPGGAPANVSVGVSRLGYPAEFIGGFADDLFGGWLKEYIDSLGVNTKNSQIIDNSGTRCAYVLTDESGNRVFKGFSKSLCADSMLDFDKISAKTLEDTRIFYIGSFVQACEKSRKGVEKILNDIKDKDTLKVYDPNLRLSIWPDLKTALNVIKDTIKKVDILKLSDDEINLISGIENNIQEAAKKVFTEYKNLKLLIVTAGAEGSCFINTQASSFVKSFKVDSVEMTGAGDGFVAGLLSGIYDYMDNKDTINIENIDSEEIRQIVFKANAVGALATTKPGAMSALPTKEELEAFLIAQETFAKV